MHFNILNKSQLKIFPRLSFLEKLGFYLAGGTALALQIGHRTSQDFDFYNPKHFAASHLFDKIESIFKSNAEKISTAKDTLLCRANEVDLSFFWYSHKLIEKPTNARGVLLASASDIAAMKLIAITGRPAQRDYIDIFYLLKKFTLVEMIAFGYRKYPNFNHYLSLRALTYFEDLEAPGKRPIKVLDPNFSWTEAKDKLFAEVKKYQLSMIS